MLNKKNTENMKAAYPEAYNVSPNQKIAFVFAKSWKEYYSCSPFYWFMFTTHKHFTVFEYDGHESVARIISELNFGYIGAVFCEVCASAFNHFDFPKMIVTDDLHRFFKNYDRKYYSEVHSTTPVLSDYCLANPISALPLSVSAIARSQMIYCPNYTANYPWTKPHLERLPLGIAGTLSTAAYPLRTRMIEILSDLDPKPQRAELREKFIEVLGDYRIGLTDDVAYGSVVAKYFEIPMAGSLLMAPEPHTEIEKLILGFDNTNSALIPRAKMYDDAFMEKFARDAVADFEWTQARAQKGQELAIRRHTVEARVRYIWLIFQRMNAGTWSIRDQFDLFLAAEAKNDAASDTSEAGTTYDGRLLIQASADCSPKQLISAIGNAKKITVIAPTTTEGERLLAAVAEQRDGIEMSYVLFDRTRTERLAGEHDIVLKADASGVSHLVQPVGAGGWIHDPSTDNLRQSALKFWRDVLEMLRQRFGSSIIHMAIEESFDWDFGAIDFWLWLSRERAVRVRAERVLRPDPYIGILVADGASKRAAEDVKYVFAEVLQNAHSTDHWQAFSQLSKYPIFHDLKQVEWEDSKTKLAEAIGSALRILIDDVMDNENDNSPM